MNYRNGSRTSIDQPTPAVATEWSAKQVAQQRSVLAVLATWFLAAGIVALMASSALGQPPYKVLPLAPAFEEPANFKKMESAAKSISSARNLADVGRENGTWAMRYFQLYVPAKITQPDGVTKITELMKNVRDRLNSAQRSNAPGATFINRWVYAGLLPIAKENYQPAARINAILFISRMDTAPANNANRTPPVPLRTIPAEFIPIYQDKTAPDGVRAAALHAVHRYVIYAAPSVVDPLRSTLVAEMKQLLDSDPPEGRSADVHAYLQRFAVDILASLRGATDAELGKKLISISTETKSHDLIALHSAARLGAMSADLRGNVDSTSKVLDSWAIRAMRAFQYEIARLNAFERPKPVSRQPTAADSMASAKKDETKKSPSAAMGRGAMGMDGEMGMDQMGSDMGEMGMDQMGMDMGDMGMEMEMGMGMGIGVQANPQPPEVIASRRKLNHVLQQLHKGVNGSGEPGVPRTLSETSSGLLGAVEAEDQALVKDWLSKMEAVITALNEPAHDTQEKWMEALDVQVTMLEEIAGPEAVAVAAQEPILLPGVSRVVAVKPVEKALVPEEPVLDEAGGPKFPENLDELAPPE
ncbi:hypothetical protein [Planctomycetes bacterium K23_9]|uniref:Uncharacterized protein n=1 Tax=Stieleria marina TaxID=1930275 RepID=A0A517NYY9_9BACT|nr:hypothetical protein K239x_43400 [Planctomycetes bacterium K23_9]